MGITYFYRNLGSHKTTLVPQAKDKWVTLPGVNPAIISRELFERVQKQLERTKEAKNGRAIHQYLLRGFAYCGICGRPLVGSCMGKKWLGTIPGMRYQLILRLTCFKALNSQLLKHKGLRVSIYPRIQVQNIRYMLILTRALVK